jgi:hypothetical protein
MGTVPAACTSVSPTCWLRFCASPTEKSAFVCIQSRRNASFTRSHAEVCCSVHHFGELAGDWGALSL